MMAKRKKVLNGDRLRQIRDDRGLSQDELAARIGMGAAQMNRYENQKQDPTLAVIKEIAAELEISVDYLINLVGESTEHLKPSELNSEEWDLLHLRRRHDMPRFFRKAVPSEKADEDKPLKKGDTKRQQNNATS